MSLALLIFTYALFSVCICPYTLLLLLFYTWSKQCLKRYLDVPSQTRIILCKSLFANTICLFRNLDEKSKKITENDYDVKGEKLLQVIATEGIEVCFPVDYYTTDRLKGIRVIAKI
jgi:hypothetical protein